MNEIGVFSFFSGAGFLDLGFETTGYTNLMVNEVHKPFLEIYKYSHNHLKIEEPKFGYQLGDISEFLVSNKIKQLKSNLKEYKSHGNLVGFIGGPPCPDFSIGGKNKGHEGDNGKLSATYIDLICQVKPDFFLFENVKGLYRTLKHRQFFDSLKLRLIDSGYYLTEKVINAIEFGAPQDRERIILLGFKRSILGDLGFKINGTPIIKNFNWSKNSVYNATDIFKLPWPQLQKFSPNTIIPSPQGIPLELTVQYWFEKNNVIEHPNQIAFFKPKAGLSKFLTIDEGDDLKKSYKRLHRWRYSPTAAYGNNEVHLHPYIARRITVAEALAIQSLPKAFKMPDSISLTDMFKSVGNGVPYMAGRGLALNIKDFLFNNPLKDIKEDYAQLNSK
jgi:DNA (cytosine-5)-methyltransferase 1